MSNLREEIAHQIGDIIITSRYDDEFVEYSNLLKQSDKFLKLIEKHINKIISEERINKLFQDHTHTNEYCDQFVSKIPVDKVKEMLSK